MVLLAFSVFDRKAEAFGRPFFEKTRGLAIRSFQSAANDAESAMSKYPNDFVLYEVGAFDDQLGGFIPGWKQAELGSALQLTASPAPELKAVEGGVR